MVAVVLMALCGVGGGLYGLLRGYQQELDERRERRDPWYRLQRVLRRIADVNVATLGLTEATKSATVAMQGFIDVWNAPVSDPHASRYVGPATWFYGMPTAMYFGPWRREKELETRITRAWVVWHNEEMAKLRVKTLAALRKLRQDIDDLIAKEGK